MGTLDKQRLQWLKKACKLFRHALVDTTVEIDTHVQADRLHFANSGDRLEEEGG